MPFVIDAKLLPKGWLQPGEKWPGQRDGLPEPGTKASEDYCRKVYEEQFGEPYPKHLEPLASLKRLQAQGQVPKGSRLMISLPQEPRPSLLRFRRPHK